MSFIKKFFKKINRLLGLKHKKSRKSALRSRKKSKKRKLPKRKVLRTLKVKPKKLPKKKTSPELKITRSQAIAKSLKTQPPKYLSSKSADKVKRIKVGVITHYFDRIQVAVVRIDLGQIIKGDTITIQGNKTPEFQQKVDSMQVESVDVPIAKKGQLIGLKVKKLARVGDEVFK